MSTVLFVLIGLIIMIVHGKLICKERNGIETFRIIQLTDTHLGESNSNDKLSIESFINLTSYEDPDLITISGDFVSGYAYNGTKGWFKDTFDYGISPIINSNIPWAYTLGNHDDQADWNRTQIIGYASTLQNSYTQLGPINIGGVSNYVLTIYDTNDKPVANVWYLDSLDTNCYNVKGWGCVEFTTVEWYKNTSIELENKFGKLPGFMYIHIPLPELLFLYNNENTVGKMQDSCICCWSLNTGLFSVIEERQDIVAIFHGHDHDNDFYGLYNDVYMGYGRKTGYGGYGPPVDMPRGARVIQFPCNPSGKMNFTTWIRENNGNKITVQPKLNPGKWDKWTQCGGAQFNTNFDIAKFYDDTWKHDHHL